MAYDEALANRMREILEDEVGLSERKMFGGFAFLVDGNMAVAASSQGGVMVRVDPLEVDRLVTSTGARVVVMRGRPMRGWLRVGSQELHTRRELAKWVGIGLAYARSLPAER